MIYYYDKLGNPLPNISENVAYKFENNEWFVVLNNLFIPISILCDDYGIIKHILIKHIEYLRIQKFKRII